MIALIGGPLYQWELGRKVAVLDPDGLITEVHVAKEPEKECPVLEVKCDENGRKYAEIPNAFLQDDRQITVYAVHSSDGEEKTLCGKTFLVVPRAKPDDYVYTETEILQYKNLEGRIKALEETDFFSGEFVRSINGTLPDENGDVHIDTECITVEEIAKLQIMIT